ncbi:hypothetical protein P170DRAFT_513733 [Aspergillus steynii IBT 23096]|uniref:DUF676 domain-containing protein n=1 Tax=Aspergillus steynii IBT 23096 TaxID=1392250 RepID=A0A2I2FVC0_9EURO|nr:uncharacterized protein P170DRAFT_513733 [Aspergillus steynii IBT 23096]PLB44572.1 hypothetical protein P170DRAFT_513733 [Aspergillus steynii IBT 23096]
MLHSNTTTPYALLSISTILILSATMDPIPIFTASRPTDTQDPPLPYTASPWRLLLSDLRLAKQFYRHIPQMFRPLRDSDGPIAELNLTWENLWVILVHIILIFYQVGFLISLPVLSFFCLMPAPFLLPYIWLAFKVNKVICRWTLNRGDRILHSTYMLPENPPWPREHERWIFLNGIAVGTHWMQNSLNRLSQIFFRPVRGIHTPTAGIVFDLIKCLIQRNFCYATQDVRDAYEIIKETLWDDGCHKLILIAHSQGGIATSLIVDWLVGEISQGHLQKLEIYTFGNAANHFNDPRRLFPGEDGRVGEPRPKDRGPAAGQYQNVSRVLHEQGEQQMANVGRGRGFSVPERGQQTASPRPPALEVIEVGAPMWQRAPFIEHYANSDDFVCLWGVIHFIRMRNRYLGHLFLRQSPGHLFVQHYLDPMFPLDNGEVTIGVNDFFHLVAMAPISALESERCGWTDPGWHLSRLWRYRNGRSPLDHYGL